MRYAEIQLTNFSTKKDMLNIKGITEAKIDKLYEIA
jgi:hypothetical protein